MDWCSGNQWCSTWSAGAQKLWDASQTSGWTLMLTLLPIWALGALTGYLLPRPKTFTSPLSLFQAAFMNSTARRALLAYQAFRIAREVWYHWTCPGTFRQFTRAVFKWLCGQGWTFDFPTAKEAGACAGTPCAPATEIATPATSDNWYVTEKDLAFYQYHAEGSGEVQGASAWEVLMDKEIPGIVKYTSWRRTLPNGKTEYKSLTYSPDATANEFMDLYLDDDNRPNWDTMIIHNSVLEYGDFAERQAVVRWVRRFPFSFISDREYTIAKRLFKIGDALYAITKAVDHPRAPRNTDVVKCDVFYSMWRSRTVACPWGSGKPACETLLLHHEQFKIPENLGRFAVKHGMWSFVRKLSSETAKFVEERRKRCDPDQADPKAYGHGHAPNPPTPTASSSATSSPFSNRGGGMRRVETSASALSSMTTQSSQDMGAAGRMHASASCNDLMYRGSVPGNGGLGSSGSMHRTRSSGSKIRGIAAFAVASGIAMLMRKGSQEKLGSAGGSPVGAKGSAGGASQRARRDRERALRRARSQACFSEGGSALCLPELSERL